jgi:hypothetical protein
MIEIFKTQTLKWATIGYLSGGLGGLIEKGKWDQEEAESRYKSYGTVGAITGFQFGASLENSKLDLPLGDLGKNTYEMLAEDFGGHNARKEDDVQKAMPFSYNDRNLDYLAMSFIFGTYFNFNVYQIFTAWYFS